MNQMLRIALFFVLGLSLTTQVRADSWEETSTKFVDAIREGHFRDARLMVLQDQRLAHMPLENDGDNEGRTALHYMGWFPDKTTTVFLLQHGALPNAVDKAGSTALNLAVPRSREVVLALIDGGANVNAGDRNGVTPLMQAVAFQDEAMIRLLAWKKANVNAKDANGSTPLHYAAEETSEKVCRLLLALGASKRAKDNEGYRPAKRAQMNGNSKIAALLH